MDRYLNYKKTWLPHLRGSHPKSAFGNGSCMYVMSLEGWRRGLDLKFTINKKRKGMLAAISFTLSDGKTSHTFQGSRGDFIPKEAINICRNKDLTNKTLRAAGVPIPEGTDFSREATNEEIIEYANKIGYPVVLKPSDSEGGGVGVITNIRNDEEFRKALTKVRDEMNAKACIVEKHFFGEDFRVYVLEDQVIGSFHRRSQSVVGDGVSDIQSLLEKKNEERMLSPFLAKKKIKIDEKMKKFLEEQGKSPTYVPEKGERVYLRRNGEAFGERDSIDFTDQLSPKMKEIAISAIKAIPGLRHGGVDMLIDLEKDEGIVNEVNSRAQISNHVYPVEGNAVDIPKILIDYYFPHTKGNKLTDILYYYDFDPVMDAYKNGTEDKIVVHIPKMPQGLKKSKRYVVKGTNLKSEYKKWIKEQAISMKLHGFVQNINSESIAVVVSGSQFKVNAFKGILEKESPLPAKIFEVKGAEYARPIKVGFEIIKVGKKAATGAAKKNIATQAPVKKAATKQANKNLSNVKKKASIPRRIVRKIKRMIKA
jgi:cyanophycin synthetase